MIDKESTTREKKQRTPGLLVRF